MISEQIGNTPFVFRQLNREEVENHAGSLRFEVYCSERRFLSEQDFPEKKELDEYDMDCCAHFGAYVNNRLVGYSRLILCVPLLLPVFGKCPDALDHIRFNNGYLAEVSRLIISKQFRQRQGDGFYYEIASDGKTGLPQSLHSSERRKMPMVFGLYREMYLYSRQHNINCWAALMEPGLDKLLKRTGMIFKQIGKGVEYGGTVYPYLLDIEQTIQGMYFHHPLYFEFFTRYLPDYMKPAYMLHNAA